MSHTAALAGSDAAVDALFRQAGVIRATSLEELIDVATLLSSQPEPQGRRVAVLTNAGGLGILCADACDAGGLELPELSEATRAALADLLPAEASLGNPVDMLGGATPETYATALRSILGDPLVDAVIVLFVPTVTAGARDVASSLDDVVAAEGAGKPVLSVLMTAEGVMPSHGGSGSHVAAFGYPESAARALGRAAERADWLRRPHGAIPTREGLHRDAATRVVERALARGDDVWLEPGEARELLSAYDVPLVEERIVGDADSAVAAAEELGYPVVVKSAEPGAHKTEVGGVALDLGDGDAVREAVDSIGAPVLVQPMVRGGAELLVGVVEDPVFGPLVAVGPGGVLAELIGEASFRIAPLTDHDAEELVLGGKAGRLVRGFRGAPPADAGALVDLVHRLARLAEEHLAVAELDLNPVIARPNGCIAVDARIRVRRPEPVARTKTW
jgi:acyl-CoA synthetase (NDP forming)